MTQISLPIVILAGGLATRLRPLTIALPKSLILINNEPFISHQLRLLQKNGFKKIVICTGFLGDQIVDYVGDGTTYGVEITYINDGPLLLGTAGAVKKALPLLNEAFFIIYGDTYLTCDYAAIECHFLKCQKQALMTIYQNDNKYDKSNVEYHHHQILAYDKIYPTNKMKHIDYGLGIFRKSAFDVVPEHEKYDLADLYQLLLRNHQLASYEVSERFYETGSFSGIKELENYLQDESTYS